MKAESEISVDTVFSSADGTTELSSTHTHTYKKLGAYALLTIQETFCNKIM
jgi:hypothetical protein